MPSGGVASPCPVPRADPPAPAPAASTGARRVLAVWQEKHMSGLRGGLGGGGLGDDEVAERVDADDEAGVDRDRRAELLDDRRTLDGVAGEQVRAPPDVGVDVAGVGVEADRPDTPVGPLAHVGGALGTGEVAQLWARDRPDAGDSEVD